MSEDFDLLGDVIPEGFGRRGRPPHRATDEKRRLVMMLQAFDWSQERIAAALSITPPTLRRNYFRELRAKAEARARVEAALLGHLYAAAEAGNVAAIDKYFKRFDRHDVANLGVSLERHGRQAKPPKLGKKEQARLDAAAPDTGTPMGDLMAQRGKATAKLN